jgi:hypothetical protein
VHKFALLIGIAAYMNPSFELYGPLNDVKNFREVLLSTYQFSPENIVTLTDFDATRENIIRELNNLVAKAGKNVHLVFFYSGHGTQVPDVNGDELDHLDEAIVPWEFDWDRPEIAITDDELESILNQARGKGAVVDVFYDACFSGGLDRSPYTRVLPIPDRFRHLKSLTKDDKLAPRSAAVWFASKENQYGYEWWFNCDPSTPQDQLCCELDSRCMEGVFTHYLVTMMKDDTGMRRSTIIQLTKQLVKQNHFPQTPGLRAPLKLRQSTFEEVTK